VRHLKHIVTTLKPPGSASCSAFFLSIILPLITNPSATSYHLRTIFFIRKNPSGIAARKHSQSKFTELSILKKVDRNLMWLSGVEAEATFMYPSFFSTFYFSAFYFSAFDFSAYAQAAIGSVKRRGQYSTFDLRSIIVFGDIL
jgi:hypothetical protein